MIFNSLSFLIFFLFVLAGYWTMQAFRWRLRGQNTLLLVASYIFYGSWDWIFLGLILLSTLWNYFFSLWIERTENERLRRRRLVVSLIGNFALLGFFKYFNFFSGELFQLLKVVGIMPEDSNRFIIADLILPVGISFFTFQASAYTIDVYRRRIDAEKNLLDFALFVVYFPQLVAGPIERAENLLTALKKERSIDIELVEKAVWNLLHGLFMKVVIADNLAPLVDGVFGSRAHYLSQPDFASEFGAGQVLLTGFAFMIQLYCDFAGYSFIALGASQLLGIPLTRNFLQPFLATNPAEFWRRWHTTLVRWFTDYIYRPLGGSRVSKWMTLRNIMIVYLISGLWHGANWTYIIWGGLSGLSVIAYRLLRSDDDEPGKIAGVAGLLFNTLLVSITGLIFRAYDMAQVFAFLQGAMQYWDHTGINTSAYELSRYTPRVLKIVFPVLLLDGMSRLFKSDDWLVERALWVRVIVPVTIFFLIVLRGQFGKEVIYFAF